MQNFRTSKNGMPFTAPVGGVVSGVALLIGAILVVPRVTAPAGATFAGTVEGVVTLPAANLAIAEGAAVYWDNAALNVTTVAGGNTKIGFAAQGGSAAGAATVDVALNGTV